MKFLKKLFSNAFSLLLLLTIAIITVLIVGRYSLTETGRSVEAKTVIPEENAAIVHQSPLAPPTATPKPPIDVSKIEIARVEQIEYGPYIYFLLSPDGRYSLANKMTGGHQLLYLDDGGSSDVTGTWINIYDLWLVDKKNGEESLISPTSTHWWWSPDGLAFSFIAPVAEQGTSGVLNIFYLSEKEPREVAKVDLVQGYRQGVWLSTEEIMYIKDGQLWAVHRDRSNNRLLNEYLRLEQIGANESKELATYTGNVDEFVISPDGKHIAYTLSIPEAGDSRDPNRGSKSELWVSEINGRNPILITDDGIILDWSPNGDWLVYSSTAFPDVPRSAGSNLNTVNLITEERHTLYNASTAFSGVDILVWSPRGDVLALRELIPDGGEWKYNLWFTNLDGSQQKVFKDLEVISQPNIWMTWENDENSLTVVSPPSTDKQEQVAQVIKLNISP
jgi:dipeptidyl aminopeptidase/acylaminoacyl peptidase